MKLSQFFISRPIFAGVLSALILLAGLLALPTLPITEYPEVVPPTVIVHAAYPGANPKVIAETLASPLEQSINGVENMLYQFSQATADGALTLTLTFAVGTGEKPTFSGGRGERLADIARLEEAFRVVPFGPMTVPETPGEKRRWVEAEERRTRRLDRVKRLKASIQEGR